MTPMTFYLSFTTAERIAIKKSTDEYVQEFWNTYERAEAAGTMINPNLASVSEGLAYLAMPAPDGPGILASVDRIPQIRAGIPQ